MFDFADDAADNPTFYAELTNPQSLNKYQYAYNNPLRYIDQDGHEVDDALADDCCKKPPLGQIFLPVIVLSVDVEAAPPEVSIPQGAIDLAKVSAQTAEEGLSTVKSGASEIGALLTRVLSRKEGNQTAFE